MCLIVAVLHLQYSINEMKEKMVLIYPRKKGDTHTVGILANEY